MWRSSGKAGTVFLQVSATPPPPGIQMGAKPYKKSKADLRYSQMMQKPAVDAAKCKHHIQTIEVLNALFLSLNHQFYAPFRLLGSHNGKCCPKSLKIGQK